MSGPRVRKSKHRRKSSPRGKSQSSLPSMFEVSQAIFAVVKSAIRYRQECRRANDTGTSPTVPKLLQEVISSAKRAEKRAASINYDTNISELFGFLVGIYRQVNDGEITDQMSNDLIVKKWEEFGPWWSPPDTRPTIPNTYKPDITDPRVLFISKAQLQKNPERGPAMQAYAAVGDIYGISDRRVQRIVLKLPSRAVDYDSMAPFECISRLLTDILRYPEDLVVEHLYAMRPFPLLYPEYKSQPIARLRKN